jgi:hypothetical protein
MLQFTYKLKLTERVKAMRNRLVQKLAGSHFQLVLVSPIRNCTVGSV